MTAPRRIFVLGLQRSGTTWLANMLAGLPEVVGVEDTAHNGVHESVFFSHFARAFAAWETPEVRAAFTEAFGQSDYFRLTGLSLDALTQMVDLADSPEAVFVAVMDSMAEARGALGWIEKSPHHSFCAAQIARMVPDARFVIVERRLVDLVTSRLHGFGRELRPAPGRWLDAARGALAARHAARVLRRFGRRPDALWLRYEDLRADTDGRLRAEILAFLDLPAEAQAMQSAYASNSSFAGRGRAQLDLITRGVVHLVGGLGAVVPLSWLWALHRRRAAQRGIDWPEWVWTQTGFDPATRDLPAKPPADP